MFAKFSALALFFLANVSALQLSVPDQAGWGTIVPVTFSDFQGYNHPREVDLLLYGVTVQKTYIIGYQLPLYVHNVVLPPVVDLGEQYQVVVTDLVGSRGEYCRSNNITIN